MRRSRLAPPLAAVVGISVLAGSAGSAQAFSFDLMATGSLGPPPASGSDHQTVSLGQFDPSLGTLNAVDITLSNSGALGAVSVSLTGAPGDNVDAHGNGLFAIDGPDGVLMTGGSSGDATCTIEPDETACEINTPLGAATLSPNPVRISSALSPFEGTGTFDLTVNLMASAPTVEFTNGASVNSASANFSWIGDLGVSYEYTPGPEPASLALLGLGLAGLCVARRRR